MKEFQLTEYLSEGVERIIKDIMKASVGNPAQSIFLAQYIRTCQNADRKRKKASVEGEHIPPFLIASITDQCNLNCKGCYAKAGHACTKSNLGNSLSGEQWGDLFDQAKDLGISFILLAGGEPLTRMDVLKEAGKHRKLLFPIFTNGTMLDESFMSFFSNNRNLIPVLSIEGNESTTDNRRGKGVYSKLLKAMNLLKANGILFGASVTVTKKNIREVTEETFLKKLLQYGCKAVIYVEYVPADGRSEELAPQEAERTYMGKRVHVLRQELEGMLFISFPGDEKSSGGCLAAGRGFFHINAGGGAEPCPFSPYSDTDLRNGTLKEALNSPFFQELQKGGLLEGKHTGGCVLFEKETEVKKLACGKGSKKADVR